MDPISDMAIFVEVVSAGSLSEAGRHLGLSPAVVSKRLARLEDRLGARLVHRTTRSLSLTEEGGSYFERCQRILADIEEAEASVRQGSSAPRGTLKITVPASFGRLHIAPYFSEFMALYPDVAINFVMTDSMIDIVQEGFDLAVRIGRLADSSLIARKLAPNERLICASPEYIAKHGEPKTVDDLLDHNCLVSEQVGDWRFGDDDGGSRHIRVHGNFMSNNGEVLRRIALDGVGVALMSTWAVSQDLQEGRLVQLLAGFPVTPGTEIYAVYPSTRNLSPKVRAYVDFLAKKFGPRPYWDELCEAA